MALLRRLHADCPHHVLALTLMHRRHYAPLHGALFRARHGEIGHLCALYDSALQQSLTRFADIVSRIDALATAGRIEDALAGLLDLHGRLT